MCGFLGVVSKNKLNLNSEKIKNEFLICRGPDEYKCYNGEFSHLFNNRDLNHFVFQFNRLAILDLSNKASQPMISKDYKSILMFNGEIFNHKELRNELEKEGIQFYTNHSDSEVILNGISVFGKHFIEKLRGQFAISYYDSKSNNLLLARDRLGQKPLFYKFDKENVRFSSNLKSLYDKNKDLVSERSIEDYLNYGVVPSPNTIFKNIYKLKPAQIITFDLSKEVNVSSDNIYWKIEDYIMNEKFSKNEFFNLFSESIKIRENADVAVATFLSGGIDSTSIVKNMSDRGSLTNTYSIGYVDNKYDESKWSSMVANKYKTNHDLNIVNFANDVEGVLNSMDIFDEPYSDPSTYPSFLISKEISNKYKVAISGDGGDELLGGYRRINILTNPDIRKSNIYKILYDNYPNRFGTGSKLLTKSKDLLSSHTSFFSDKKLLGLLDISDNNTFENDYWFEGNNIYKSILITEYKFFLSEMMMLKVDRTSMANSLEVRSPFVDHKLIEYILSHEASYFQFDFQKSLLKNYLLDDFDKNFVNRDKKGFVFNVESFIYKNIDLIFDILNQNYSGLNQKKIKKLKLVKSRINALRIWRILFLEKYLSSI